MAILEIAFSYVLFNEGKISENPADKGGLTNAGITQATYSRYLGRPATREEMLSISDTTKLDVYRRFYWTVIKGDSIKDQNVATAVFDMAVNMGPAQATKLAQSIIGASQDGIFGPKTLAALNTADPKKFLAAFSQKCCQFYGAIAMRDVTQAQFLAGWTIRAHRIVRDLILA